MSETTDDTRYSPMVLERLLRRVEEAARGATPGRWRRNHACITSVEHVDDGQGGRRAERHLVALADVHDLNRVSLLGHAPDAVRASGNARYLEAASPDLILELVRQVRLLLAERAEPVAGGDHHEG